MSRLHFSRHLIIVLLVFIMISFAACSTSKETLDTVNYTPQIRNDWDVSTPEEQGVDPTLVAQLYHNAESVETINSLIVIKGGKLIAEKYFNGRSIDEQVKAQSRQKVSHLH